MARRAILLEDRLAELRAQAVGRKAGKRAHVRGGVPGALGAERRAQRRHHAHPSVHDRFANGLRRPAVEPVVIAQIGKAAAAARIRAVTLRAFVEEEPLAHRARLRIRRDGLQIHREKLVVQRLDLGVRGRALRRVRLERGPAQHARNAAEPRIRDEIAHRKYDRDPEEPHPPAGKRVVVFGEVAVPRVAGRFDRFAGRRRTLDLDPARRQQQPRAIGDGADRADDDPPVPEARSEIAHGCTLGAGRTPPGRRRPAARTARSRPRRTPFGVPGYTPRPRFR